MTTDQHMRIPPETSPLTRRVALEDWGLPADYSAVIRSGIYQVAGKPNGIMRRVPP